MLLLLVRTVGTDLALELFRIWLRRIVRSRNGGGTILFFSFNMVWFMMQETHMVDFRREEQGKTNSCVTVGM